MAKKPVTATELYVNAETALKDTIYKDKIFLLIIELLKRNTKGKINLIDVQKHTLDAIDTVATLENLNRQTVYRLKSYFKEKGLIRNWKGI